MCLRLDCDFAKEFAKGRFFFGVANAPYLCEGGYNVPGGPYNNYGYYERDGRVPRSGETNGFWTRFREHVSLAASLGMDVFRMGLDWSRVQPAATLAIGPAPRWDERALDHYAEIVGAVRDYGLEPIITLHHFTHPAWLGEQMWLSDEAVDLLIAYELRVVEEVNNRLVASGRSVIRHFITFNELNLIPQIYYLGVLRDKRDKENVMRVSPAYDNVLRAHIAVYDGLYDLFERKSWGPLQVGFGTASAVEYDYDRLFLDFVRLRSFGVSQDEVDSAIRELRDVWASRMERLTRTKLTDEQYEAYVGQAAEAQRVVQVERFTKALSALYSSPREHKLDYISVNVYEPLGRAKSKGVAAAFPKWWEFGADPEVYYAFIHAYNDANRGLPVYMGENSLAYRQPIGGIAEERPDGWDRDRFLRSRLMTVVRCMIEGVPVRGFIYWSLVDDFEWEAGFEPRLGLYNYDYVNQTIRAVDARGYAAGETYAMLAAALRSGDKERISRVFTKVRFGGGREP